MDGGTQSRWHLITEGEMLKLGARRVTPLEPVGTMVLLALPDGSTLRYESGGELSTYNMLTAARYVLADGRPVAHNGQFYVGSISPVEP